MNRKGGVLISPSILSADFARLGEEIVKVQEAGADWLHVDVMDGQFVPNLTMGPFVVEAVRRTTALPIDVHLMVEQPLVLVEAFARAGANLVYVHVENQPQLHLLLLQVNNHDSSRTPASTVCSERRL